MNRDIKKMFKRETQDLGVKTSTHAKFDELFYIFSKLVEYDVDVEAVEGLRERLLYALSKIASEKLDRNDVISLFPIIWGKFESFVRKLLYICDKQQYLILVDNTNGFSGLNTYLSSLGISVSKSNQEWKSDSISITYNIRNNDSHVCEAWSLHKFYKYLGCALDAYLFVVEKTLPKIQKAITTMPTYAGLDLSYSKEPVILFDPIIQKYNLFYRISDFNCDYTITSRNWVEQLVKMGISETSSAPNAAIPEAVLAKTPAEPAANIRYEFSGDRIARKIYLDEFKDGSHGEVTIPHIIYEYDEDGHLKRRIDQIYMPQYGEFTRAECSIEYEIDGSVLIIYQSFTNPDLNEEKKQQVKKWTCRQYDPHGKIIKYSDREGDIECYQYNDEGVLTGIERREGISIEVEYWGDEVIFTWKRFTDKTSHLYKKYKYVKDRIERITIYRYDRSTDSDVVDDIITLTYNE